MPSFDISSAMKFITLLSSKLITVYKQKINMTLLEIVNENQSIFEDYQEKYNLLDAGTNFLQMTLRQFLLMAACCNVRFISAQDRENRLCLTKNETCQLEMKMTLVSYMTMKPNAKYADEFDKYFKFVQPKSGLATILTDIFGTSDFATLWQKHIINSPFDWESLSSIAYNRRMQVLVYDMLQMIAYIDLVTANLIDPISFNINFIEFHKERSTLMTKRIANFSSGVNIVLLQETHLKDYNIESNDTNVIEPGKTDSSSVIIVGDAHTKVKKMPYDYDIENHDIAVATLVIGTSYTMLFSIHTPTTGRDSAKIINNCFDAFNKSACTHMIIGIDANTKTIETKRQVVEVVLKNNGYFSYFPGSNPDEVLSKIIEREKTEITSTGMRTFGLQSQFSKAGDPCNHYVDYVILAHKPDKIPFTVTATLDTHNDILTNTNPSDHSERVVDIEFEHTQFKIISYNVAGPNGNYLEYAK